MWHRDSIYVSQGLYRCVPWAIDVVQGLCQCVPGEEQVAGCCEHGNEPSGSISSFSRRTALPVRIISYIMTVTMNLGTKCHVSRGHLQRISTVTLSTRLPLWSVLPHGSVLSVAS